MSVPLIDRPPEVIEIQQEDPEHVTPCTRSNHPAHEKCGQPSDYVIIATCPVCEMHPRYVCALCCSGLVEAYIENKWCVCTDHHAPHAVIAVRVRGL